MTRAGRGQVWFSLAALALSVAACDSVKDQRGDAASPEIGVVEVTLERTACLGGCPIYSLTIDEQGWIRYEGTAFVARVGADSATIAPERVRELVASAEALGYFGFADSYARGDTTCPEYFPDSPSIVISISSGTQHKGIRADHGCTGVPPQLQQIAEMIDRVAGSARWVSP